jgi:sortase A
MRELWNDPAALRERSMRAWSGFKKLPPRRKLSYAMVLLGVMLLGYVGVEYFGMYRSQRELSRQFAAQQERAAAQQNAQVSSEAHPVTQISDGLMRLSIPKISLDAIVVEGSNRKSLMRGPGHLEATAYPGDDGNVVITAHRDTFFRHIYELNKGDVIQVQRNGITYLYEVTGKKVVDPSDVSVAAPTKDARLTLITCYPTYFIGPAPERLVVFSRLLTAGGGKHLEKASAQGNPH